MERHNIRTYVYTTEDATARNWFKRKESVTKNKMLPFFHALHIHLNIYVLVDKMLIKIILKICPEPHVTQERITTKNAAYYVKCWSMNRKITKKNLNFLSI